MSRDAAHDVSGTGAREHPTGGMGRLAGMSAAFLLALLAQSEGDAGRTANCLLLYGVAVAIYLAGEPPAPFGCRSSSPAAPIDGWRRLLVGLGAAVVLGALAFRTFGHAAEGLAGWRVYMLAIAALLLAVQCLTPAPPAGGIARRAGQTPSSDGRESVDASGRIPACEERRHRRSSEVWVVTAILVWAAFMRLYRLDEFPAGIFYDEAINALDAQHVGSDGWYPTYFPDNFGRAPLYEYLLAGTIRIAGSGPVGVRLLSAFAGVLTVAVFYRVARGMYSLPVAALAALLLAGSSWHANFSRIAFDAVLAPLFLLLCLHFLTRSWRRPPPGQASTPAADYVVAGLWLGLGLLTYQAFRLVPFLVVAAVALVPDGLRRLGRARGLRHGLACLAIVTVTATVAAVPLLRYAASEPALFWQRARTASVLRGRTLWEARQDILESARAHLLMFNVAGDSNGRHNLPGEPMLHPLAGALLVLGMVACLSAWRRYQARLLLAWFAIALAGGVMSLRFEAPHALRTLAAAPAVFLIAAAPLEQYWSQWRATLGTARARALMLPTAIAVAWLLGGTYHTFFVRQAGDFAVWNAFSTAETYMAKAMARLGDGWSVYVDPLLAHNPVTRLLAPEYAEADAYVATELLPLTESGPNGVAIFVGEQDEATRRLIEQWYPSAEVRRFANPSDGHATLYQYMLTAAQVAQAQGLEMIVATDMVSQSTTGALPEWQATDGVAVPVSIIWQGVLLVPEAGRYSFRLDAPGEGRLLIDSGSVLMPPTQTEATVELAKGRHSLWLQLMPGGGDHAALSWLPPGSGEWQAIARRYLYHWPVEAGGLQGDYIAGEGDAWDNPALSRIDPRIDFYFHVLPLQRPYRVRWHGWLTPPVGGEYTLVLAARDRAELWLNGELVLATELPDVEASVTLPLATPASIEVRFWDETAYTKVSLSWRRPDGITEPIPYTALRPPVVTAE